MKALEKIRTQLLNGAVELGKLAAKPFYRNENWLHTHHDLYSLPTGSIGREMVDYLDSKHFILAKGYEPHDVKHILTGYEMDMLGEIRMQWYLCGNGNHTLPVLFTLSFGSLLVPEHIFTFWQDYQRGKKAKSLFYLDYAALVYEDKASIQKALHILDFPCESTSILQTVAYWCQSLLRKHSIHTISFPFHS
jgi:hypothetical protein